MGVDPATSTAVVVGATGSIGAACVQLIAERVRTVICIARNETRLRTFVEGLAPQVRCELRYSLDLAAALREADLVLTATSSTQDVIEPEALRPGAVVCELSLPHDVSRRVAVERPDVLVIEGGNMRIPGAFRAERVREPGTDFDLALSPGTALACMSETMVLALEGRAESFTLGRGVDLDKVREIDELAHRAGFELADMRAFDKVIPPEDIAARRAAADARRAMLA
jgi:predicted amino acid dehydrogenase